LRPEPVVAPDEVVEQVDRLGTEVDRDPAGRRRVDPVALGLDRRLAPRLGQRDDLAVRVVLDVARLGQFGRVDVVKRDLHLVDYLLAERLDVRLQVVYGDLFREVAQRHRLVVLQLAEHQLSSPIRQHSCGSPTVCVLPHHRNR